MASDLTPATLARTILALASSVRVTAFEDEPHLTSALLDDPCIGVFLAQDGTAYLILRRGADAPRGPIRVECSAPGRDLGTLHLEGTCSMPVPSELHASIHAHVSRPRPCPHGRSCATPHHAGLRDIAEIRLDTVRVHPGGDSTGVVHTIDPVAYACATPDPWLVDLSGLRAHLERDHQALLRRLVTQRSPQWAEVTVTVHELTREHLTLGCLSIDGVSQVTWHFDDAMASPGDIAGWIARQTRAPHHR